MMRIEIQRSRKSFNVDVPETGEYSGVEIDTVNDWVVVQAMNGDRVVEVSTGSDRAGWTHRNGDGSLTMRTLRRAERIFETLESM